jgi:hypothetical protein
MKTLSFRAPVSSETFVDDSPSALIPFTRDDMPSEIEITGTPRRPTEEAEVESRKDRLTPWERRFFQPRKRFLCRARSGTETKSESDGGNGRPDPSEGMRRMPRIKGTDIRESVAVQKSDCEGVEVWVKIRISGIDAELL